MIERVLRQASRLVPAAVLAFACLAPTSAIAVANDLAPRVISGEVIRLRGQWMTKSQPAELQLPGGGHIQLHSNTDASLLTDPQSLMLLPGKKTPTYSVILRRGLIDLDVSGADQARVAIAVGTPTDVRIVTLSGQCTVKVEGRNVIAVSHQGLTTVSQGPKLVRLPLGVKRAYQGQSSFADQPLLEATRWVGGRRVWIAATGEPIPISGYVWDPVSGASGYRVSLRELVSQRAIAHTRVAAPVLESFSQAIGPGKYEIEIAAIDRDGFVSASTRRLPLNIVGLELPGGAATLPKDTVMIAAEQRVRLIHADGLTLTTAAHKSGVSGSEPFGLEGLDRAAILIHPPGGGDTATLTLVRRESLVSTWVGPKLATWPDDPVQLQVSFVDARGIPTPGNVEPTVRVTVGVDPVQVQWDKQGSLWQAKLPPVRGKGPWVVRLEVLDQYGVIIGRDFAEIAKTRVRQHLPDLDPNAIAQAQTATRTSTR